MNNTKTIQKAMIAPCGMNCYLCRSYLLRKKACGGCRGDDNLKSKACKTCKIKNCEKIITGNLQYCSDCEDFPCNRLNHLDRRYRTKYNMSMIDNLNNIKNFGINKFIKNEIEKWSCPGCSNLICVHKSECISCGYKWR